MSTCAWSRYTFQVNDPKTAEWNDVGGVYIFARADESGAKWYAQYIGETQSFAERLPNHEEWPDAVRLGTTHIHTRTVQDTARRQSIEIELIRQFEPPLNDHWT